MNKFQFFRYFKSSAHWNYGDLSSWPASCTGESQSPINIDPNNLKASDLRTHSLTGIYNNNPAKIVNNGHTVSVHMLNREKIVLGTGGTTGNFHLDHIHFHWPSEHTIEGKKFPLEIHLVFMLCNCKNFCSCFKSSNVVVLSTLVKLGTKLNASFNEICEKMHEIEKADVNNFVELDNTICVSDFLPNNLLNYYRYEGSLTTPDCREGIPWTVFSQPLAIRMDQIRKIKHIRGHDGEILWRNSRPVQPLHGRRVFVPKSCVPKNY